MVLHTVNRLKEIQTGRIDLSDPTEPLQVSALYPETGKIFSPHKHILKEGSQSTQIQEVWVVVQGSIKCTLYDLDDTVVAEETLMSGDCIITFQGGHALTVLEEHTIFYEIKTGPYKGKESDYISL